MNKTIRKVRELEAATKRAFQKLLGRELKEGESVAIEVVPPGAEPAFDTKFQAWTKQFIEKYRSALESLAKK
ncbi:MAG: hypothetical protein AAB538_01395 [Patescibacteria group bacterium]